MEHYPVPVTAGAFVERDKQPMQERVGDNSKMPSLQTTQGLTVVPVEVCKHRKNMGSFQFAVSSELSQ